MKSLTTIKVDRRNGIICWKVDCNGAAPNTVLSLEEGIVAFVKLKGESKYTSKSKSTIYSLFKPGKSTKLIGGSKAYEECEIIAVDTETKFDSEWGLGGPTAIPCKDKEIGIRAKAAAFGNFYYTIEDYFGFVKSLKFGDSNQITREAIREELRASCVGVVRSFLTEKLANKTLEECQANINKYCVEIKKLLDKALIARGLSVCDFTIGDLHYAPNHEARLDKVDGARFENVLGKIKNEGRRDDISIEKEESEIDIGIINALKGNPKTVTKTPCPRCKELNENTAGYCSKCGEKLQK